MDTKHLHLQYDRLQRHYQAALPGKDEVAFLDLAHVLRIWVELKSPVTSLVEAQELALGLPHYTPPKFIKRTLQGARQISIPLASGVQSPGLQVSGVRITNRALSADEIRRRYEAGPPTAVASNMSFREWMAAAVIEVPSEDDAHPHLTISREILIKRVANVLGASHPAGADNADEFENRFDAPVLQIHAIETAGYKATYYQLLGIAQDILSALRPLRELGV